MTPKRQAIGATPGRVTEIEVKSIELDAGQVKRKPARGARPRGICIHAADLAYKAKTLKLASKRFFARGL